MKANAPEKLYIISDEYGVILSLDNVADSRGDRYDFVDEAVFPFEDGTFEYTRTDAFIEKADEFVSTFFHPDDTELIDAVLNRFHEHMKSLNLDLKHRKENSMTDKEKILAEIERLKLCTMDEHMKFYSEAAEGEYNAFKKVLEIINSLPEEPVSEELEEGLALTWEDIKKIDELMNEISYETIHDDNITIDDVYKETLKQFNELKRKKL